MKKVFFLFLVLLLKFTGVHAMASENIETSQHPKQWSLFWGGDWRAGDYAISVDESELATLVLFDTANNENSQGAGILEGRQYDRAAAEEVRQVLCDKNNQAGRGIKVTPTDAPATFSASCNVHGQVQERQGHIALLPEDLFKRATKSARLVHADLLRSGAKKVWINASVLKVERTDDGFVVVVRIINSGKESFSFKRPDLWSGNSREETLSVGAVNLDPAGEGGWEFDLAGQPLENKAQFKDDIVKLAGGSSRDFAFRVKPKDRYKAGAYAFSADAWLYIDWMEGPEKRRAHVDFYSGKDSRTTIKMDRDYPSTPQEREQWEATHRASMSSRPVKPGQTFAEDGLYRAVRTTGTARGLLLKPFKAGAVATTDEVRMYTDKASGTELNGPVQWVWEASAPTPIKQWSFDLVDGTQQFCEPGVACPRSGRWVPRVSVGYSMSSEETRYLLAKVVTLRRGDKMPAIEGNYPQWEWAGAANG